MSLKSLGAKIFAGIVVKRLYKSTSNTIALQEQILKNIVSKAKTTNFGLDHDFDTITSYEDYKKQVPAKTYEEMKPYFDAVLEGQEDVLWPGKPLYLCKTSGTTSGAKYIPISKDSMSHHIDAARNALLCYINETGRTDFVNHKMIFLQGSPTLERKNGNNIGRLSGIVANYVPKYLQKNRLPSYQTNCITDWETKVDAIVEETFSKPMGLISGIPSWVQMYFEKLKVKANGKSIADIFPDFSLFVYGGVNFEPYRSKFLNLIGKEVDSIQTYPASEGFIAFQDVQGEAGMLLNINAGIFFEFIPLQEFGKPNAKRICLKDVELDVNYVLILNTNAGLFGYNIGDTVKFTSLKPFRVVVSGRVKHFTSAFGEHVIAEEVETSLKAVLDTSDAIVSEFTVAPQVNPEEGLPFHEWFIEFEREPTNWDLFINNLDNKLQSKNPYYKDLIKGRVLQTLKITICNKGAFENMMKAQGKLGGQNKIPRLTNDRSLADKLCNLSIKTVQTSNKKQSNKGES